MEENTQVTEMQAVESQTSTPVQDFWRNLAALIKVKTIVTLVVIGVFAALALTGALQPDTVMTIVSMVVAFYFGTQTKKE